MTFPADLLEQARHLAKKDPNRPKQASLRRAISTAYYALFHLLTSEAARLFAKDKKLSHLLLRTYGHGEMYDVSSAFSRGEWPRVYDSVKSEFSIPDALKQVAQTFADLQQARHTADYDLTVRYSRSDTFDLVERAEKAFRDWQAIRNDDLARIYLGCFLLWKQWDRTR